MPFDLQPTLKGSLLELRPLRPEDFDKLFAVASDPLIWEQHPSNDRYQVEVFKNFFREALQSRGALIAIDSKDGRVVGSSRFHGYDEEKSEIEIGWTFLARSHWGGIYNGEMKELMLRHAFKFVDSVVFLIGQQNLRSQKAVEKIGGVHAGSRRDASGRESFVYRITSARFPNTFALRGTGAREASVSKSGISVAADAEVLRSAQDDKLVRVTPSRSDSGR
jgi:RimJ/RimL family protein N-acetyltransferase